MGSARGWICAACLTGYSYSRLACLPKNGERERGTGGGREKPIPDTRYPMPDARCPMSDVRCPMSDVRCPIFDVIGYRLSVSGYRVSGIGHRVSDQTEYISRFNPIAARPSTM